MDKQTEALKLALEALGYIHEGANNQGPHTGISWRCVSKKAAPVITALRQALANEALDKMAENARELRLDYEPVPEKFMDALKFDVAMREALAEQPAQQGQVAWTLLLTGENQGLVGKAGEKFVGAPEYYERVDVYTSPPAQRKPLTREQVKKLITATGYDTASPQERTDFINGIRHAEAAHGIKENT